MPTLSDPTKEKLALLLAEGWRQIDVSRTLKINPVTVYRWKNDPEVALRISELRSDLTTQSVARLREKVLENTDIILDIAKHGGESGVVSSQLKAALWCVEKVLGKPDPEEKIERQRKGTEAKLLKLAEDELQGLAERGE